MVLTDVRTKQGRHSLRMRSIPSPAGEAAGSDWGGLVATRTVAGEDWSRYNRISVWIYPDVVGAPAIAFTLTLHNDGEHKLPDRYNEGRHESIILKNRTWNHVVWEIEPLARDKITALDIGYSVPKKLPDPGDSTILDIDQLELERVEPDHVEGWDVTRGKIAFSHSGYTAGASKTAVASDLSAREFRVMRQDTGEVVLSKLVQQTKTDLGEYQVLDFSEVREPGTYVIQAGDTTTRSFRIGDDAWNRLCHAVTGGAAPAARRRSGAVPQADRGSQMGPGLGPQNTLRRWLSRYRPVDWLLDEWNHGRFRRPVWPSAK
jgi:hypothetical protein